MLTVEGQQVTVTHPRKLYFSGQTNLSKLDLANYYLAVASGALAGIRDRPIVLKRFVNGAFLAGSQPEPFYQKRAPSGLPSFLRTVALSFPSGRTAEELVVDTAPGLAWIANLGCIELHPHAVRASDLDHPDELRIDLDPNPGVTFADVRSVALEVREVLIAASLVPFIKTSGSRGMHINVRIHPNWSFTEVRRAALALAREVERRIPALASSKWWKEERHGVFLDYNQNAKDRTTASAYSVRPLPDARVSAPITWDEVPACDPADFTVLTLSARFASIGDPHSGMDESAGSLEPLLELAARDEASGIADAPWPPHFAKQSGESKRVAPSRAKKAFTDQLGEGFGTKRFRKRAAADTAPSSDPSEPSKVRLGALEPEPASPPKPRKARIPKSPLITISQSPDKTAAAAGLARWRAANPEASSHLAPDDILTDRMRGASTIWYRIRVNLRNVPESERPLQQTPDPDDDPTRTWREAGS
ncbi:MAG: DNA primase [Acidobacteriota bacterium]|nr:DNA primase [Acidobacteriota bacterium]